MTTEAITNAVGEVRSRTKKRNFVQSIDLAINLKDLDMNRPENRIDDELVLPHGRGKAVKIALIAEGELAHQAKKLVDRVVEKDELEELAKNKIEAKKMAEENDFFISQANLMPTVGRFLGPVLGPRGKMPKPVPPTANIKPLVARLKKTVKIRSRDKATFHLGIATEGLKDNEIADNIGAVLRFLENKLEKGSHNIKSIYLSPTMGQSVRIGEK
ncbi:MAG: 50S ribosomal protein L1 [Candidatus Hydrothermarchaeales archaeon]